MEDGLRRLLTAEDLAEAWQVDPATIRKWARGGRLPSLKLGPGVVRFDPEAIEEWLGGQMVGTPAPVRPPRPSWRTTGGGPDQGIRRFLSSEAS